MKKVEDGYIVSEQEMDAIATLISCHPEDPRESLKDALTDFAGPGDPNLRELCRAFQKLIDDLGIGHNEAPGYQEY